MYTPTRRRETRSTISGLFLQGVKTLQLNETTRRPCSQCGETFEQCFSMQAICPVCVENGLRLTAEQLRAKRAEERRHRLAVMGLVGKLTDFTFTRYDRAASPEAYDAARLFVESWADPCHRGLAFLGIPGSGKTHIACAILHALADLGVDGRYVHVPAIAGELRAAGSDWAKIMREKVLPLHAVDVLVLDDVGREKESDAWAEARDALINDRWVKGAPTILTANLSLDDVMKYLGEAGASRFFSEARHVDMPHVDHRYFPVEVPSIPEHLRDATVACSTCQGAGWLTDARLPVSHPDKLMKCPSCSGRGW